MATTVRRGTATIDGVAIAFDVIVSTAANYTQSAQMTQNYEVEAVKDNQGATQGRLARDEHAIGKFKMLLTGGTKALAKLAAQVASALGQPFLPPLTTITLSGGDLASFAGQFQLESGSNVDLGNMKVGEFDISVIKWADGAQNTLLNQTPS